ncbi:MAG TPA: ABC transporter ATP-binding protein [Xanthobacteraceae bacterium]
MSTLPAIDIQDISVRFRTPEGPPLLALERISAHIEPRSFLTVVGPSGCGKTTLLKVLSGVLPPSAGEVCFDGRPLREAAMTGHIGYVFQRPMLLPWRTALANVMLTMEVTRKEMSQQERQAEARRWLEIVGLRGFEERRPHELSGGMQQRVSIARALVFQPQILLMDEPFAALDEITREAMQGELLRLWSRIDTTVIFITHSIPEAVLLSERVLVLSARPGRIIETIEVPFPRPRTEAIRGLPRFAELTEQIRRHLRAGRADIESQERC